MCYKKPNFIQTNVSTKTLSHRSSPPLLKNGLILLTRNDPTIPTNNKRIIRNNRQRDLPRSMNDRSTTRCCQLPRLVLREYKGVEKKRKRRNNEKKREEKRGRGGRGQPVKKRKRRKEKSRGRRKKGGGITKLVVVPTKAKHDLPPPQPPLAFSVASLKQYRRR